MVVATSWDNKLFTALRDYLNLVLPEASGQIYEGELAQQEGVNYPCVCIKILDTDSVYDAFKGRMRIWVWTNGTPESAADLFGAIQTALLQERVTANNLAAVIRRKGDPIKVFDPQTRIYQVNGLFDFFATHHVVTTPVPNDPRVNGSNVIGGSGRGYASLNAALAGETDVVVADTTQAGTIAGKIIGSSALSSEDNAYKDWIAVLTDSTPDYGLVYRCSRVSSYTGATKTIILDRPWDFHAGKAYKLISPIRLQVWSHLFEDVAISKNVEIDFGNKRLYGKIDITSDFVYLENGAILNGIQQTSAGYIKGRFLKVSRRDSSIYALLLTQASQLGRCDIDDCEFFGVVAARRGTIGWEIIDCRNDGIVDDGAYNLPYRLMESVDGVPITYSSFDATFQGEFAGAFLYSEESITGSGYYSLRGRVRYPDDYSRYDAIRTSGFNHRIYEMYARNDAVLSPSLVNGGGDLRVEGIGGDDFSMSSVTLVDAVGCSPEGAPQGFFCMVAESFSGTFSPTFAVTRLFHLSSVAFFAELVTFGTAMTGTIAPVLTSSYHLYGPITYTRIALYAANSTGSINITGAGQAICTAPITAFVIYFGSSQNSATFSVTSNNTINWMQVQNFCGDFVCLQGINVSNGSYTIAGSVGVRTTIVAANWRLGPQVTGGTFLVSASINYILNGTLASFTAFTNSATGGTLTYSGTIDIIIASRNGSSGGFTFLVHDGAGSSTTFSGAILVRGGPITGGAFRIVNMTAAGTVNVATTFRFTGFISQAAATWFATVTSGTITGPTNLHFKNCEFESTTLDRTGSGTLTWSGATFTADRCSFGHITWTTTSFATIELFNPTLKGNTSGKSITASGTRPTTYRIWGGVIRASVLDNKPEVIRSWLSCLSSAALGRGSLAKLATDGRAAAMGASDILDGVVLDATTAANQTCILVRDGDIFTDAGTSVAAGDYMKVDTAAPTQGVTAALGALVLGQTIGRALEDDGTTFTGECYTRVGVR